MRMLAFHNSANVVNQPLQIVRQEKDHWSSCKTLRPDTRRIMEPHHDDRLQSLARLTNCPSPTYVICEGSTKAKSQSSLGAVSRQLLKNTGRDCRIPRLSRLPPSKQIHSRLSFVVL